MSKIGLFATEDQGVDKKYILSHDQKLQKLHIYGTFIRNWHIFLKVAHFSKTVYLSESLTFNLSKTAHLIYPKLHISPKMAHFPKATHLSENGRLIRK